MEPAKRLQTPLTAALCETLRVGERILLSGEVYTARDAAHKRLYDAALKGDPLPFPLAGATLFYAAPTPARPGKPVGSIGPTTSSRMDRYTPKLLELGLKGMIGKGRRSPDVIAALGRYRAVYFGAIGGTAALLARCIRTAVPFAYADLGPEAIMRLELADLPVVVLNDVYGGDLYDEAIRTYGRFRPPEGS